MWRLNSRRVRPLSSGAALYSSSRTVHLSRALTNPRTCTKNGGCHPYRWAIMVNQSCQDEYVELWGLP